MRREEIHIGVALRVTRDRWDARAGTCAMVDTVGHAGKFGEWCFTVRWHLPPPQSKRSSRRNSSLNLFEADLADFEIFTGPLPPIPLPQRRRARDILAETPSLQLSIPYTADEFVSDRLDLDASPLTLGPLWDFDLDL